MTPLTVSRLSITFITLLLCTSQALSAAEIEHVSWMLGCWSGKDPESTATERWTVDGHEMKGVSETGTGANRRVIERMTINRNSDGNLVFTAWPEGQDTASFVMVNIADDEVVFENREHDFPQRIIYRLLPDFELLGRIEGVVDGKARSADFPMQRADCHGD
jgi:hypothetical protein